MEQAKVRLYVDQPLAPGQAVALNGDQAHYLFAVMRLAVGARVALFNGRDGEWQARIAEAGKRGGIALCEDCSAPLRLPPDLWLLFAPIKKARTAATLFATEPRRVPSCPISKRASKPPSPNRKP